MFSKGVLSSYLYVPIKEVVDLASLKEELTVMSKYGEGTPIRLYDLREGWIGVPIFHSMEEVKKLEDRRVEVPIRVGFTSELWEKQDKVIETFTRYASHGITGFILEAKPGSGKTVMAIKMISILGQRTLVVVPRSNLIKQWRDRLLQHSDLKASDVGWVEGGRGEWRNKKVVVGLVHSLVLDRLGDGFRKNFGLVIFDEVDRSVPPQTFAPAIAMFPAKYRIGMSATLKRPDGMEIIFQKHLGQVHLRGEDEGRMKPTVLIHHFTQTSGYVHMGSQRMNRRGMLLSRLAKNPIRNELVAKYTYWIWKSGRQCMVLSDRKIQLISIKEWLILRFKVPARDIGFYVRSLGKKQFSHSERERAASACKILLCTYGMIQLGTDIKSLAGLIYATPQSETEQSRGRIERVMEGKQKPVVVDIVDTAYGDTQRWAQKRLRHYRSQGLEVKVVT